MGENLMQFISSSEDTDEDEVNEKDYLAQIENNQKVQEWIKQRQQSKTPNKRKHSNSNSDAESDANSETNSESETESQIAAKMEMAHVHRVYPQIPFANLNCFANSV